MAGVDIPGSPLIKDTSKSGDATSKSGDATSKDDLKDPGVKTISEGPSRSIATWVKGFKGVKIPKTRKAAGATAISLLLMLGGAVFWPYPTTSDKKTDGLCLFDNDKDRTMIDTAKCQDMFVSMKSHIWTEIMAADLTVCPAMMTMQLQYSLASLNRKRIEKGLTFTWVQMAYQSVTNGKGLTIPGKVELAAADRSALHAARNAEMSALTALRLCDVANAPSLPYLITLHDCILLGLSYSTDDIRTQDTRLGNIAKTVPTLSPESCSSLLNEYLSDPSASAVLPSLVAVA